MPCLTSFRRFERGVFSHGTDRLRTFRDADGNLVMGLVYAWQDDAWFS